MRGKMRCVYHQRAEGTDVRTTMCVIRRPYSHSTNITSKKKIYQFIQSLEDSRNSFDKTYSRDYCAMLGTCGITNIYYDFRDTFYFPSKHETFKQCRFNVVFAGYMWEAPHVYYQVDLFTYQENNDNNKFRSRTKLTSYQIIYVCTAYQFMSVLKQDILFS